MVACKHLYMTKRDVPAGRLYNIRGANDRISNGYGKRLYVTKRDVPAGRLYK